MLDARASLMAPRAILVADDDALLRESLCDLISDLGHDPQAAGNGAAAQAILDRTACALLLSDVDMPDMTGFALLAWTHAHRPLPTVLMSARADDLLDRAAHDAGALHLWRKPVALATVRQFVTSFFAAA
jgi:CheY-like chemotaxis protein